MRILSVLSLAFLLVCCKASRDEAPVAALAPAAPQAAKTESTEAARRVIRTGRVTVEVKAVDESRRDLAALAESMGGYIASSSIEHHERSLSSAIITVRVPEARFADFVARVGGLGALLAENTSSEDVTEQFADQEARLANARKLEARLLEIVASHKGDMASLLEVEREVARVREQIEQFEAKQRLLGNQTAFGTVEVSLIASEVAAASPPSISWFGRAKSTLVTSVAALLAFANRVFLLLLTLLPWTPVFALAWYAGRRLRQARTAAR